MTVEEARDQIEVLYGSPLSVISDCLRGFIIAREGCELIAADFSNIEGRVLAWLAGEEWKLRAFVAQDQKLGPEIYELMAQSIYGLPHDQVPTKFQRLIGKVAELACGYQGATGAFQSMAKNYLIKISDDQALSIVRAWRSKHPVTRNYWYKLEDAARFAVRNKGQAYSAGAKGREISFKVAGSFLWARLPSGRSLCYPYPSVESQMMKWGELKDGLTFMGENQQSRRWERQKAYGGMLAENVTQAVARDLLAEALIRLEENHYPVVMHVHDEAVCELEKGRGTISEMEQILCKRPKWAMDLPISAEGWRGSRYRK